MKKISKILLLILIGLLGGIGGSLYMGHPSKRDE